MRTEARNGFKYLAHLRRMHHHPANPFRSVRKMLQAQTIRTRHLPTRRENYSSQPRPAIHAGMIGSLASKSFYVHRSRAKRLMQQKACHDGMQDSPRKNGPILGHLGKPGSPIEE